MADNVIIALNSNKNYLNSPTLLKDYNRSHRSKFASNITASFPWNVLSKIIVPMFLLLRKV